MLDLDEARRAELVEQEVEIPPTEDKLPYDDGVPVETPIPGITQWAIAPAISLPYSGSRSGATKAQFGRVLDLWLSGLEF